MFEFIRTRFVILALAFAVIASVGVVGASVPSDDPADVVAEAVEVHEADAALRDRHFVCHYWGSLGYVWAWRWHDYWPMGYYDDYGRYRVKHVDLGRWSHVQAGGACNPGYW